MSKRTSIRCYDYVNRSYDTVCKAMTSHSNEIFHLATKSAETRAEHIAAGLHVKFAGVEFGKEILIDIKSYTDIRRRSRKEMAINLEWSAAAAPQLFPKMVAKLLIYPITATETQLDFMGEYDPPMGFVGRAIDGVMGRRIAEACVHHFVSEIAEHLRETLEQKV